MWSCNSGNDGEQSLRLHGVHPNQQTDLHFQESPQDQVVQEEAFMDHGGCSSLGAARVDFGWHQALPGSLGWSPTARCSSLGWCSSTPSSELGSSVETLSQFFGVWSPRGAFPRPVLLWASPTVEVGCRNVQSKVPNSVPCPSHPAVIIWAWPWRFSRWVWQADSWQCKALWVNLPIQRSRRGLEKAAQSDLDYLA